MPRNPHLSQTSSASEIEAFGKILPVADKTGFKYLKFNGLSASRDEGGFWGFVKKIFFWLLILVFIAGFLFDEFLRWEGYHLVIDKKVNIGIFSVGLEKGK